MLPLNFLNEVAKKNGLTEAQTRVLVAVFNQGVKREDAPRYLQLSPHTITSHLNKIFDFFRIDGKGSGKLHKLHLVLDCEYRKLVGDAELQTDANNTESLRGFQEAQPSEQSDTVSSEQPLWQTLEDVAPYLEMFEQYCKQEQYLQAFYIIFDIYDYDTCIYNFLLLSGYADKIVNLYEQLVQSWKPTLKEEEKWEFGAAHNFLGHAYVDLGQYENAITCYQQCLEIAEERGDIDFKALSLIHLGSVYHSLKKYAEAIEYNRSGLEIGRKIGSKEIEAKALKNLGLFYSSQKQYDLALDYHHHSLVISSQTGDVVTEVQSLLYIGVNYRNLGEYQQALLFLEQGIEIAHQSDNRKLKANIAEHLYVTLIRLKEQSVQQLEAIAAYKKAHELFQDIGLDNYAQMCADFNEPA